MTGIRVAITLFVLVLVALVALGWNWTSQHQPPAAATASHVVLGLAALSGLVALVAVWRSNPGPPPRSGSRAS